MDYNSATNRRNNITKSNYFSCNGKLMLISLVVLVAICVIIVFFHSYARWAHRRRQRHQAGPPVDHRAFNFGPTTGNSRKGLERSVLQSLPTFVYDSTAPPLECSVCLSELVENESGRILPKCNHRFHTDCIDMWFSSHSNCPLCRAPVKPNRNPGRVTCAPAIADPGSSFGSGSAFTGNNDEMEGPSSSRPSGDLRKPTELIGITVEGPTAIPEPEVPKESGPGSGNDYAWA